GLLASQLDSHPDEALADTGYSLATSRSALEQRAVVIGRDHAGLLAGLRGLAAGTPPPGVVTGRAEVRGKTVFVFPGQGAQWAGMAPELLDSSPVFARRIDECAKALAPYVDWSLDAVLRDEPGAPPLQRVDVVQPVLWAVMVSLAELWREYGLR